jgi:hypothetical protein
VLLSRLTSKFFPSFRARIPPFTCARTVLQSLVGEPPESKVSSTPRLPDAQGSSPAPLSPDAQGHSPELQESDPSDILSLCRDVNQEVIQLKIGMGFQCMLEIASGHLSISSTKLNLT